MARRGQQIKLTKALIEEFDSCLALGAYFKDACDQVGIGEKTAYRWLALGAEEERRLELPEHEREPRNEKFYPIMLDFYKQVRKRTATVKNMTLGQILLAGQKDWRASAWFLERRYPKEFGASIRAEVSGDGGGVSTVIIGIVDQIKKLAQSKESDRPGSQIVIPSLPAPEVKNQESVEDLFDL